MKPPSTPTFHGTLRSSACANSASETRPATPLRLACLACLGAGGWAGGWAGKLWKKRGQRWTTLETNKNTMATMDHKNTTNQEKTWKTMENPPKRCVSHGFIWFNWFNIFQPPPKMRMESANSLIKCMYPNKHALSDQHVRTLDSLSVLFRHWGTWSILVW